MEKKKKKITEWPQGKPPVRKFRFSKREGDLLNVRDDGPTFGKSGARRRSTYLGDNSYPLDIDDATNW